MVARAPSPVAGSAPKTVCADPCPCGCDAFCVCVVPCASRRADAGGVAREGVKARAKGADRPTLPFLNYFILIILFILLIYNILLLLLISYRYFFGDDIFY
jgi:hypothetical protein